MRSITPTTNVCCNRRILLDVDESTERICNPQVWMNQYGKRRLDAELPIPVIIIDDVLLIHVVSMNWSTLGEQWIFIRALMLMSGLRDRILFTTCKVPFPKETRALNNVGTQPSHHGLCPILARRKLQ